MLRSDWILFYPLTLEAPPLLIVSRHYTKTHIPPPLRHPPVYIFVRHSSIDYMKFLLTHEGRGGGIKFDAFWSDKRFRNPPSLSPLYSNLFILFVVERAFRSWADGKREPWENEFLAFLHTRKQHILMVVHGWWLCVCEFNKYYYTVRSILEDTCYLYSHIVRPWWYFHIYKVMCASRMLKGWWGEENYYFILEMCTSELLW